MWAHVALQCALTHQRAAKACHLPPSRRVVSVCRCQTEGGCHAQTLLLPGGQRLRLWPWLPLHVHCSFRKVRHRDSRLQCTAVMPTCCCTSSLRGGKV